MLNKYAKSVMKRLKFNKIFCRLFAFSKHNYTSMTKEEAYEVMEATSPRPSGEGVINNEVIYPYPYDLQIIVSAFNVEKYLQECMDSILAQKTKYSYIVYLIDDGSTDKTSEIADSYSKDNRVKVIHQANKGFSGARNTGLKNIVGEYISFVDSDDMLPEGAIEALMSTAKEQDADIVQGGYYKLYGSHKVVSFKTKKLKKVNALGNLLGYPCGKVFKSVLWGMMQFPEGYWFEDSIGSFLIYPKAKSSYLIPQMCYIYRQNENSITHTFSGKPKSVDTYWITELLVKEHDELGLKRDNAYYEKIFRQIALNAKRVLGMSEKVREAVFVLTHALLCERFSEMKEIKKYKLLQQAINNKDFGLYEFYAKYYY